MARTSPICLDILSGLKFGIVQSERDALKEAPGDETRFEPCAPGAADIFAVYGCSVTGAAMDDENPRETFRDELELLGDFPTEGDAERFLKGWIEG